MHTDTGAAPSTDIRRARAAAGCLLGLAVGDALGLPYEGLSRRRQQRWFRDIDRHRLIAGRGLCSDDTEHAWVTAQALLAAPDDASRFAHRLAWKLRGWLLGLPAGIGFATLRACVRLWLGFPPERAGVHSAGNGAAMRAPILGVCCGDDPATLRAYIAASTRLTHRDVAAEHGALAIACAAHIASAGDAASLPQRFLARIRADLGVESPLWPALSAAVASVERGEPTAQFAAAIGCSGGVSGYVLHTVPADVHAWLSHPADYAHAVTSTIRLGGDTDTTAALVGALVGARVGTEGIPAAWRDGLAEWPRTPQRLRVLGERAAQAASTRAPQPEIHVPWSAIAVRNIAFLLIVLAHGRRRLLPPYR